MPSHEQSTSEHPMLNGEMANAFHPEFLARLDRIGDPLTAAEAAHGGFWRVVQRPDESYGLYRVWESPEKGDEPFAVLQDRSMALLAAAFLPLAAKSRTLWSQNADDGRGQTLYRDAQSIGQLRYSDPEFTEILNLAEALVRSPESIAALLEAAGSAALEPAGKILAREALTADA